MKVSTEDFIVIWQHAASVKDVAKETGLSYHACIHKACILRKHGVPLKLRRRGKRSADEWARLADLATQALEEA